MNNKIIYKWSNISEWSEICYHFILSYSNSNKNFIFHDQSNAFSHLFLRKYYYEISLRSFAILLLHENTFTWLPTMVGAKQRNHCCAFYIPIHICSKKCEKKCIANSSNIFKAFDLLLDTFLWRKSDKMVHLSICLHLEMSFFFMFIHTKEIFWRYSNTVMIFEYVT